jgi:putative tryptophan/tyrosine transport system substrate-binding protein
VKRRDFLLASGAAILLPLRARAQSRKTSRIAVISPAAPLALMTETSPNLFFREFFLELKRLGYIEGETLEVHRFSSEGNAQRHHDVVAQAVRAQPDVIFAFSSRLVKVLKDTTSTIPVVGYTADPISFGIVTSLARPGGNVTGVATEAGTEIDGKRLSLWKEIAPSSSRVGVLAPSAFWTSPYGSAIRTLAGHLGFTVVGGPLADPVGEAQFRAVFAELERERADVVLIPDVSENNSNQRLVVELARQARLPTITSTRQFVKAGALMSYAPDPAELVRQAAGYVDEVLRGAKPGELPFVQPTRFEFLINSTTARTLGLEIPPTVLARADEEIE